MRNLSAFYELHDTAKGKKCAVIVNFLYSTMSSLMERRKQKCDVPTRYVQ